MLYLPIAVSTKLSVWSTLTISSILKCQQYDRYMHLYDITYTHFTVLCSGSVPIDFTLLWRHNGAMASQITSLTTVYSTVYSGADQRKL